ncbi:MAG: NAD-binding protein, partial [candidate division Zixibacteria bacterium]|nr:NAD-binding protein [candidate division Zixibacteria bacterium]
ASLDGVLVLHGDGTSGEILEQAGIEETDYLLALTRDDENNILISLLAKEKKVDRVIALAHKPQYRAIIERIGVDSVVNPRSAMVDEIIRCTHLETLSGVSILEGGKGQMMEFEIKKKSRIVDVPLAKIRMPKQTLIGAIVRKDQLIIPRGGDRISVGDRVVVFAGSSVLSQVKQLFE